MGLLLALLTWLPSALLTAVQEVFFVGSDLPFFSSVGTYVRLLVGIPLFFLAEMFFDRRVGQCLRRMTESGIIAPIDHPAFDRAIHRAMRWRDAWLPELLMIALVFVLVSSGIRTDLPSGVHTWQTMPDGSSTLAGRWYVVVSLPTFQFLILRWGWRLAIWWALLWRLSRLDLQLMPTHPDRAGGLGLLGVAHVDLSPLSAAGAAVLAANFAQQMSFSSAKLEDFVLPAAGYVIAMTLLLIAPLFFFTPRLLEVKQRGTLAYGALAADYTIAFDRKWLQKEAAAGESILGTADLQSLADLGNSFGVVQSMGLLPITVRQLALLTAAAILPMAPLLLKAFSLNELVINIARAILQI
jgi:hypothetical protein